MSERITLLRRCDRRDQSEAPESLTGVSEAGNLLAMSKRSAREAIQRACEALRSHGRQVTADPAAIADAMASKQEATLRVPFLPEHVRYSASQRQQYSSWGWGTPSIDDALRALDQTECEAILEAVRAALPTGIDAALGNADGDLDYGVAKEALVVLHQTRPTHRGRKAQ